MKKRVFSILLALILLLQAMPMQVYAASDTELLPVAEAGVVPVQEEPEVQAVPDAAADAEGASTFAFDRNTGYPTDLNNQVYVAIYKGKGFPGEPAWYPQDNYTFFNSNFGTGSSAFASSANGILKPGILDLLTPGPDTSDGVKVWGHYSSAGTKSYFVDGSPLTKRENEEKIIRAIKGSKVDVDRYEIIWYVIKFQTDTYWHIDGLIVEKETYNVNYYGNGNSSGNAPTGATGLLEGDEYTVLGNTGNLKKVRNGYEFTFLGWNTRADGSGTHYDAGDKITITEDVSLYAQWQSPLIDVTVTKQWNDHDNQDAIRPDSVTVYLLQNDVHYGTPVTLNADNNWRGSWRVPAFDQRDNVISYHVEEEPVAGYSPTVTGSTAKGFAIANTHTLETTSVQAQKIWDDGGNRDGIRPYGIEVQLYKNGTPVTGSDGKKVRNQDNGWAAQWTGLEKNQTGKVGVANEYTVREVRFVDEHGNTVANPGYSVAYGEDGEVGRLTVTNSYSPRTQNVQATKVWNDANDQDGIRPQSVTLTLYANGVSTSKSVTLDGTADANGETAPWVATFTNAYVNKDGVPIAYSIVENEVSGYTYKVTGDAQKGFTVTNTHTPTTTSVPVAKVWNDAENQDGIRPASVTVELLADGQPTGKTLKLDPSNNWSGSFDGLQKFRAGAQGTAIVYTVKETTTPAGYKVSYSGTTITNTHTPATIKVNVEKVWDDVNDQDGKRPDAVVITLHENGRATDKTLTLSEANGWKGAWENLPKKHNGQDISYSAVETGHYEGQTYVGETPKGYVVDHTHEVLSNGDHLAKVINSYAPEKTFVSVQKDWEDDDNRAGLRPEEITVTLYQSIDGGKNWTEVTSTKLNEANFWAHDFSNLPKYNGGKLVAYKVEETPVAGYTTTYSDISSSGVITVTNTRAAEKISVTAQKIWDDGNNRDGIRPQSVTVALYANGIATGETVVLDGTADAKTDGNYGYESKAWEVTFSNLYKHYNGKEIVYSVEEVNVPAGYEVSYNGNTIVNTHAAETISYPVTKIWVDAQDQDGIRPDEVTVTLFADGVSTGKSLKLNASNNWTSAFDHLPKYKEGAVKQEIDYSVQETKVDGYTAEYVEGSITNTHIPAVTSVSVRKIWSDFNNVAGQRPQSIVVHLLANGVHMGEAYQRTLSEANEWTCTWENLPEFKDGEQINYTVYEEEVGRGYSVNYSTADDGTVLITNSRQWERTTFTVQKIWEDANNQDNLRYAGVEVQLYANGHPYGDTVVLTAQDHWSHTWTNLPVHTYGLMGHTVDYTVAELSYVNANNTSVGLDELHYEEPEEVEVDSFTGIHTITNTHSVQKTDVTVRKLWADNDDQDGKRPDSVSVTLYNNGTPTNQTAILNEENDWTHTFAGLDVHHGIGVDNVYTVVETNVSDDYKVTYGKENGTLLVTNTHTPEQVSVPVRKVWNDADDQDGKRPDSIEVTLYANEVAVDTLELNISNNWHSAFTNLPKYANGAEISYTVAEVNVPEGYTSSVAGTTITNSYTPETANLNVQKRWEDADDQDGKRPDAVEITLYENGRATDKTLILSEENGWKGVWEDMPRYHNGQRISYTAVETGYYEGENYMEGLPEGYIASHDYATNASGEPLATLTNSYQPEKTSLNVQKVWEDDDNRAGNRPASITVQLLADGRVTGKSAQLNPANEWDATFLNLNKYRAGHEIRYTVKEVALDAELQYEVAYEYDYSIGVATITNTRQAEKTAVSAEKIWVDDNDRDGIRPKTVTVELYANGIATGETVTLDGVKDAAGSAAYGYESAPWTVEFANLYEYYMGSKITYSVVETNVAEGYEVSYKGNQIINTHNPETISIPVEKHWNDGDNHDALRPETIKVKLLADGEDTGKSLTLAAKDNWMGAFEDLLVYDQGKKIAYSIVETVIDGYNVNADGKAEALNAGVVNGKIAITNTHKLETTELTAVKVWNDGDDQDGKRPASITLHLLANGVHMGMSYKRVLNEENGWTYTWKNLQKNYNGEPITYTVFEESAGDDYEVEYLLDPENPGQITVTNSYTPETKVVSAVKVWNDDGNRDGLRPASVTVELYANEQATGKTLVLNEDNEWFGQWLDLPKYFDHGTEVVYDVAEIGYTDSEGTFVTGLPYGPESVTVAEDTEFAPGMFLLTNTHVPATTGVSVSKTWKDEDNNDGKRPDGILVQLYASRTPVEGAVVELNEANRWTHTWTKIGEESLYVYMDGQPIVYTVDEVGYVIDGVAYKGLPEGYTKTFAADGYQLSITNTHALEKLDVAAEKIWNDGNNNDGLRPESLDVTLYCNDKAVATVALNEENDWAYTWKDLNKYISGEEAVYTVKEAAVEGYTSQVATRDNTWIFVNTHEIATKDLSISKVWMDASNADGLRPDSIQAQLYKNGEVYGNVLTLTKKVDWKVTVPALPVYENGEEIIWTVKEVDVPKYYNASYDQSSLTITNTIQSKDIPKTGDSSNLLLWSGAMFVSAAGLFVLLMEERKRRHSRR